MHTPEPITDPHAIVAGQLDESHAESFGHYLPRWEMTQTNGLQGNFLETLALGLGRSLQIEHIETERGHKHLAVTFLSKTQAFKIGTTRRHIVEAYRKHAIQVVDMLDMALDAEDSE
jgi:hypothetical protein